MKRLIFNLDEETSNLLAKEKNKAETVRQAIKLYQSGITTDKLAEIRGSYQLLTKVIKELDSKIDYIASRLK